MNNEVIFIPDGWTYFAHRTNTSRWDSNPFSGKSIILKKIMSAVTENDLYEEVRCYGKKNKHAYSLGDGSSFEIRTLICKLNYLRTLDDILDYKRIMNDEFYFDKNNFGGCRGQRHPSIPNNEELIVIGFGDYDEVNECSARIIWTIPKRFIPFYINEVAKGNNRMISLYRVQVKSSDSLNIL